VFGSFGSGSQLASQGPRLFVASGHGDAAAVVALELATGDQVWRTDLDGTAHLHATTDELLIVSSQTRSVGALDAATGQQLWEYELPVGVRGGLGGGQRPQPLPRGRCRKRG
jgi:outer membrane protein assembly factor BamB